MMEKVFIDTGAFFEFSWAKNKDRYQKALSLFTNKQYEWYSSSYVFDELITLITKKVSKTDAVLIGEKIRRNPLISWLHPSVKEEKECWDLFKTYQDKEWSYTDCMSLFFIKKYKIDFVFSFDHHFTQMGLKIL